MEKDNDLISRSALLESFDVCKVTEYDESGCGVDYLAVSVDAIKNAPAVDAEPVRHGCEYCSGRRTEYYHTTNTKLYINTFGNAQALETECNPCPPYSDCSLRGIPVRSAFIINYCPNCGRKLDGGANDAAD
jgi:hypothetical protein